MMRPPFVILGAFVLLVLWLGLLAYQNAGDVPASVAALGDAAQRVRLPGLAARCYLLASVQERRSLERLDRESPRARLLVQRIIAHRMLAARMLLGAGYVAAAERVALEGARADYGDAQARALLLEIRLQGPDPDAARRELMLMVLQDERPELLCLLGQAFAASGRDADAESFFRRALSRDGGHVASLLGMAQLAAARGDHSAANDWLQKATQSAERPDEKRAIARLRPPVGTPWERAWVGLVVLGREHGGSLLFALAYLVFLFSPALVGLLRRSPQARASGREPQAGAAASH
ncbi:hypothetical protein LLH23_16685 [bacterium]|nr:hypothetical protein [bacterium]